MSMESSLAGCRGRVNAHRGMSESLAGRYETIHVEQCHRGNRDRVQAAPPKRPPLAGAEIVGSDNMARVRSASFRRRVERAQAAGRFRGADLQFASAT